MVDVAHDGDDRRPRRDQGHVLRGRPRLEVPLPVLDRHIKAVLLRNQGGRLAREDRFGLDALEAKPQHGLYEARRRLPHRLCEVLHHDEFGQCHLPGGLWLALGPCSLLFSLGLSLLPPEMPLTAFVVLVSVSSDHSSFVYPRIIPCDSIGYDRVE